MSGTAAGSCTAARRWLVLMMMMAALDVSCTVSFRLCSQQNPLSSQVGAALRILEADTECETDAGLLHYSWEVIGGTYLYRQIEISCSGEGQPGTWMIDQHRTLSSSNGRTSYSLPSDPDDVIITSCQIRGCYEVFGGGITVYLTNTVSVICAHHHSGVLASSAATGAVAVTTTALDTIIPAPTTSTSIQGTQTIPGPKSSLLPIMEHQRENSSPTLQYLFALPAMAVLLALSLASCVAIYRATHSHSRKYKVGLFEEKKFDPELELTLGPIAGQMATPYPSQDTLCALIHSSLDRPCIFKQSSLSLPNNFPFVSHHSLSPPHSCDSSMPPCSRDSSCCDDGSSKRTDSIEKHESSTGNKAKMGSAKLYGSSKDLQHCSGDELALNDTHLSRVVDEPTTYETGAAGDSERVEGEVKEVEFDVQNDCVFPAHFIFELPLPATASSGSEAACSSHYQTSSSGYVTDTSGLFSPLSLTNDGVPLGNEPIFHGNHFPAESLRKGESFNCQFGEKSLDDQPKFDPKLVTCAPVCEGNVHCQLNPGPVTDEVIVSHKHSGHDLQLLHCDETADLGTEIEGHPPNYDSNENSPYYHSVGVSEDREPAGTQNMLYTAEHSSKAVEILSSSSHYVQQEGLPHCTTDCHHLDSASPQPRELSTNPVYCDQTTVYLGVTPTLPCDMGYLSPGD